VTPTFPSDARTAPPIGRISLVGAGPGDPELLTLKAARLIAAADIVLHDRLIGPGILELASPSARVIDVGKRCGSHSMKQEEINRLLVDLALDGAHVVRLKGGDPFVFGRGGEELDAARAAGIACEIVPGVTAACAAAARLAVPLTHRGKGRSLHFVSGHGADAEHLDFDWRALARADSTLVVYMGSRRLEVITQGMIAAGVDPDLPAIAIENATLAGERSVLGAVATVAAGVAEAGLTGPTLVIFGEIARQGGPAAVGRASIRRFVAKAAAEPAKRFEDA
jgi:uroporphyrin-III C-methyltransferase